MSKTLKWVGATVLVFIMIRGTVPLIPIPLDFNEPTHAIRVASFFGISLTLVGVLFVGALMAARSSKKQ